MQDFLPCHRFSLEIVKMSLACLYKLSDEWRSQVQDVRLVMNKFPWRAHNASNIQFFSIFYSTILFYAQRSRRCSPQWSIFILSLFLRTVVIYWRGTWEHFFLLHFHLSFHSNAIVWVGVLAWMDTDEKAKIKGNYLAEIESEKFGKYSWTTFGWGAF